MENLNRKIYIKFADRFHGEFRNETERELDSYLVDDVLSRLKVRIFVDLNIGINLQLQEFNNNSKEII